MGLWGTEFTWFLPAKEELQVLYTNRTFVGNLTADSYWTSTEASEQLAWSQNFGNGLQSQTDKAVAYKVRAIKSF